MTALIISILTTHDGTTKARIKVDGREHIVPVPYSAKEGDWLKLVDGQWRLQARAA